ncbi:MAG: competence/damage-inducible protein A [Flavobacteriales bacterium]|nr:competence/damage-inducible protein A [Flavobacteriales bacterium]MCB9448250.1 competence/damage-inducible protein A [Flavobacteriales bacterium]
MKAEIITIGDEILIGQIVDTNSAWMSSRLNGIGVKVAQITSISDRREHILEALKEAEGRADVILITGGLGPTPDDLTKDVLAEYFQTHLVRNDEAYRQLEGFFKSRNREMSALNARQADLPANCTMLPNPNGTAPGMQFEERGKVFVSMPGVPFEMKAMMDDHVLPWLKNKYVLPFILHRTILTQGIAESTLYEMIASWEEALPDSVRLAYLPSAGMVRLRLTATGEEKTCKELIAKEEEKLRKLIPQYIYGADDETLESVIGRLLLERNATMAIAESCTGGYIAHRITSIPGSSAYFLGGVVSYANEVKTSLLGVDAGSLRTHGAVSEDVVLQMAAGARKATGANYAVATSGVAGPDGGTEEKPVGLVWIAVAGPTFTEAKQFRFVKDRMRNIELATQTALGWLRRKLEESPH